MIDLITQTRRLLSPSVLARFATLIGEDSAMTAALVTNAVPLLLGSRGVSAAGMDALVAVMAAADDAGLADSSRRPLDAGLALLAALFGGRAELMARALAGATGSTISAATRALGLGTMLIANAAATVLSDAGRPANRNTVAALLGANRPAATAAMSTALQAAIASLPGLAGLYGVIAAGERRNLTGLLVAGLIATIVLFIILLDISR